MLTIFQSAGPSKPPVAAAPGYDVAHAAVPRPWVGAQLTVVELLGFGFQLGGGGFSREVGRGGGGGGGFELTMVGSIACRLRRRRRRRPRRSRLPCVVRCWG